MTQNAREIAERLIQLQVSPSVMSSTSRIFEVLPETLSELGDPTVSLEKRNTIIDSVFPTEVRDTLKLLCEQNALGSWKDIAQQYSEIRANAERQTQVRLRYVTKPTEKQLLNIQKFVFDKYKTQHFDFPYHRRRRAERLRRRTRQSAQRQRLRHTAVVQGLHKQRTEQRR